MIADAVEQIAQDFATFTREVIGVDGWHDGLDEPISCLADLARRLHTAVNSWSQDHGGTVLTDIARMEANAVEDHVAWLRQCAYTAEQGEALRRLKLAASQGWTAIEILQRAQS